MNKRLKLLYFSATGTTARIVKEVAGGIGQITREYDVTLPANREGELAFASDDLVIVGVPVYAGRVPEFLTDYFSKVKGNHTQAIFIVVYGNRDYDDALLELKDIFEKNGFSGIAAGAFIGEHSYTARVATGRPDIADLKIARTFGVNIKSKLGNENRRLEKGVVKGQYPYKERSAKPLMAPVTNDNCVKCGLCARLCPVGAIDRSDCTKVDATKCIKCCRCIKNCPTEAKAIHHPVFEELMKLLIAKFGNARHEPELFI
jgi:ferredoxin